MTFVLSHSVHRPVEYASGEIAKRKYAAAIKTPLRCAFLPFIYTFFFTFYLKL